MAQHETKSYSEILADYFTSLKWEDIPDEVIAKAKTHIIDSIGVGLAGTTTEWFQQAKRVCYRLAGPPDATVLGEQGKLDVSNAALANTIAIAALDYDDTDYSGGGGHMSRYVIGTALSVGQAAHRSGRDVLMATVAGYELAARIGCALLVDRFGARADRANWGPQELAMHHRMQSQGVIRGAVPGLFAAAVEAGLLFGLDARQVASAQGLVAGLGLFPGQTHREGADAMPLHGGWASHAGVVAALWAKEGLNGPRLIYEGDRGFLSVIAGDLQDAARLTEDLGKQWNTLNNVLKFYPAGHGTHHFMESVQSLMTEHGFTAADVLEVECHVPAQRVEFHFEPKETKLHPSPYNARFSLPYLLARLLTDGRLGPLSFTRDKVSDPKVLDLATRMKPVVDEQAWFNERGLVVVKLRNGASFRRSTPHLLGFPKRPCTHGDVIAKFKDNAALVFSDSRRIEALIGALESLEEVKDVGAVMDLTAGS